MDRNPNRPFSQSRGPSFVSSPSIPVPAQSAVKVADVDRNAVLAEMAQARSEARKDYVRSWQRIQVNVGLWANVAGLPNDIQLISYTVPEQSVLKIVQIGVQWNDPYLQASGLVDTYLLVGGSRLPNWQENAGFTYLTAYQDAFYTPYPIEPIYVQANQTVEVYAVRNDAAFVGYSAVAVRLVGAIRNLAGGSV